MRLLTLAALFLTLSLTSSAHAALHQKPASETGIDAGATYKNDKAGNVRKKYKDDELLVKFKPDTPAEAKKNLHKKHGAGVVRDFRSLRLQHVKLKKGMSVEEAIKLYQADPSVEYAEPDFLYQSQLTPNDPQYGQLWGMTKISAPAAWNATTGSPDVVVAIIDSGIDFTHADLQGNLWVNPNDNANNGLDNDGNGYINDVYGANAITGSGNPMDDNGHGTHVAGTIGAVGSNGVGVAGVNWSVKMVACKFLDAAGYGFLSDAIDCLVYVRALKDRGVNIVATNNSWGGGGYSQSLYDAIKAQQDILFIAAAGNDGINTDSSPHYPSSYDLPNVISVAATDSGDQLASFSNFGSRSVDVGAPGASIYSTLPAKNQWGITGGYGTLSGTSMATPHVTGLAALLKAQDPARDASRIRNLIFTGGDAITALSGKSVTGRRINAFGSLGSPTCINRPLFVVGSLPGKLVPGVSYTLSALSVNCDSPAGPVTVATSDGGSIQLTDPDGDGTFTGSWTPVNFPVTLTFTSPAGTQSLTFNLLRVMTYLPEARLDGPYSQPLMATGGSSYTWAITGGALPAGMTLDPATGIISGTATVAGTYTFTAQVTDSTGAKASGSVRLVVNGKGWLDETWGKVYDGESYLEDKGVAVATDGAGNSYVAGQSFNGVTWDAVLLKYDSAGNVVWSRTYDRGEDDIARAMAYDGGGHIYLAGKSGALGKDLLLKYDADGNLLWERVWDRGADHGAWGVATDSAGFVYTAGTYDTALGERILLSKYDPDGNTVWTKSHDTTQDGEAGYSVALDEAGNIFVGGKSYKNTPLGPSNQALVLKYDASGNPLWAKTTYGQWGDCFASSLAVDRAGDLYVLFNGLETLGAKEFKKYRSDGTLAWELGDFSGVPETLTSAGDYVLLAGKGAGWILGSSITAFDSLGKAMWFQRLDQGVVGSALGIAADDKGFTITGYRTNGTDNDIITARFQDAPAVYDFTVSSVSMSQITSGEFSYTVKTKNLGTGNGGPYAALYFSKDEVLSSDDVVINVMDMGPIPGGTEKSHSYYSIVLAPNVPCGTYHLIAVANYDHAIKEIDTTNNNLVGADIYTVSRDLTIAAVSGSVSGGNINYSVTERNIGNSDARYSTTGVYLSRTPVASTSDYLLTSFSAITDPGRYFPGQSEGVFTGSVPIPADLAPGTYYITAIADIKNDNNESDKTNNSKVGNVVLGPDLSIASFTGSVSGGSVSYNIVVRNESGDPVSPAVGLYFSGDAAASPDDYQITVLQAGSIPPGSEVTLTGTVPVPAGTPAGLYYLTVLADPGNNIAETSETNNGAAGGQFFIGSVPVTLNYSVVGMGSGKVSFTPGGSCRTGCGPVYDAGTTVTLTAIPDTGSLFKGWGGVCSGSGSCTVAMNGDRMVSAQFEKDPSANSILAGHRFSGAVLDGVAWMWGTSYSGQMGDGLTTTHNTPTRIPALEGVASMATGAYAVFTLALKPDGTVLAWGSNDSGQLGDGTTTQRNTPVQVAGLSDIAAVAAGGNNSTALRNDGTVWSWGDNGYGQLGDGTTGRRLTPVQVVGLSDVRAIATGSYHSLALRADGTVWAWGYNYYKSLGDGTTTNRKTPVQVVGLSDVVAVAAGIYHSVALKADGTVWTWGGNWVGQIGDGTTITCGAPFQVPGVSGVVAIAAGSAFTAVLKADGTVLTWGENNRGQLGDGTMINRPTPAPVHGLAGAVSVAAGYDHVLALKGDGSIWGWGNNFDLELGYTTYNTHTTPIQVTFDKVAPTTTATPPGGIYASSQTVTLAADEAATIYYTTDGSLPTTASAVYSAPLTISGSTTLRYFAKDGSGNRGAIKTETYTVGTPAVPAADFTVSATSGAAPLSVNFSDLSTGATSWIWDFGDSATSAVQNPVHLYGNPGSYTVTLTATGPGGSNTKTKSSYLLVGNPQPTAIQPEYDSAADGALIKIWSGYLTESPVFSRNISVRIGGGYDFPYLFMVGATKIHGTLRVKNGKVTLSNVVMR